MAGETHDLQHAQQAQQGLMRCGRGGQSARSCPMRFTFICMFPQTWLDLAPPQTRRLMLDRTTAGRRRKHAQALFEAYLEE